MGVTGKGNYKKGQGEQGEDLLGKETDQKSEMRSGRWAEAGRGERRNKLHTKPGIKPRCLKSSHSSTSSASPGETHQQKCPIPSSACADLAKNSRIFALSQVC